MRWHPLVFFLLTTTVSISQEKYPKGMFQNPVDIPIVLSGTFGELRSNHFHAGIDIKTQLRQGLPIYAIAEGTVTRIKISHWGYGKALYVAHPNGHTSVYAHLQKFGSEIEQYIKNVQYNKKSYEVEVFPDYGELEVKQGEVIAFSGNTGSSAGPHLHFEIRNSVTERPINPLLYDVPVRDATNPTLLGLYGYPLSEGAQINQSEKRIQLSFSKQPDGSFLADKVSAAGAIGFGFTGFDRQDMAANKNGVYAVKQSVNGKVYSEYTFDSFSFGESRYINTLIDYPYYGQFQRRIQKLFKEDSNRLSIYKELYNKGIIPVKEGLNYTVAVEIADVAGNTTKVIIPVEGKRQEVKISKEADKTDFWLVANKPNSFDLGGAKVYFPQNTFYDDFYIDLKKGSDTVVIHNKRTPVHRNFTLSFDVAKFSPAKRKQLFIARLDDNGKPEHFKTYKRGTTFNARIRNLGTFTLAKDTVAPEIRPKNFKPRQWLNNYRYLSLQISDDLSGIASYNATINGEWILMEYEPKTRTISYNFDDKIAEQTQCVLKVVVSDNVGNTTTFEETFFRK